MESYSPTVVNRLMTLLWVAFPFLTVSLSPVLQSHSLGLLSKRNTSSAHGLLSKAPSGEIQGKIQLLWDATILINLDFLFVLINVLDFLYQICVLHNLKESRCYLKLWVISICHYRVPGELENIMQFRKISLLRRLPFVICHARWLPFWNADIRLIQRKGKEKSMWPGKQEWVEKINFLYFSCWLLTFSLILSMVTDRHSLKDIKNNN